MSENAFAELAAKVEAKRRYVVLSSLFLNFSAMVPTSDNDVIEAFLNEVSERFPDLHLVSMYYAKEKIGQTFMVFENRSAE